MTDKIKTGRTGEDWAAEFLEAKGYEIVFRNFRHRWSEIDLIAIHRNTLVFIEVKTRRNSDFGEPEQFVSKRQAQKIREGAEAYMNRMNWNGNIRFDIVAIKTETNELVHFEDAIQ